MDELQKVNSVELPFAALMGVDYVSAAKDRVVARLEVRPELCTIPEVLHGGAIMAFADTVGATATALNLPDGMWTTTIESKTNFVGPAPRGAVVTAETTPVHRGRTTMVWQTKVTTDEGKLVAVVIQTQLVIAASK